MDFKDLGVINAGQFAGKGLIILADYVDTQTGKAGAPVFERYSTWINIAGGLALQVLAVKFLRGTSQFVAVVAGSHMLTKVVDYAREAAAPAARVRAVGAPVRVAARMAPTVAAPAAAPVALF